MKGILKKTEEGWFVVFDRRTMQDPSAEDGILPLHFEHVKLFTQYTDYSIDWDGKEVEWDRITEWDYDRTTYAKLVQTDENGKLLTYWGGFEKSKQESYICPHTKIQCDDECCVSAENCNIDDNELEYPISDDCEEVKNWDSFVEQKNKELEIEKLAGNYALNRGISEGIEQRMIDGFVAGYNKAKETLYTEEQIKEAIKLAHSSNRRYLDWLENDIITSLKQKK
jgi:hypothetical protein